MTAAGGVVGEHDIAFAETFDGAVAGLDLYRAGQSNDLLAPRRRMEVVQVMGRSLAKKNSCGRLQLGDFHIAIELEVDFFFFEVRFVVRSAVNSHDLHESGM